ncbi:hypothetical protein MKW94_024555, partial [Papaver nudicaule]|nr:hypothetical protein [Papaver nudicaule]
MAIAEANLRMDDLRVSDVTAPTTTKEEEVSVPTTTTEEDVVVPTRIEEQGRKFCCATCYKSDGRVIHVALEGTVTLEPNAIVSKGLKRRKGQLYYTNRFHSPGINSRRVEAGKLDHPAGPIRIFNVICNFCDQVVGWHYTARRVGYLNHVYWYDTLMD